MRGQRTNVDDKRVATGKYGKRNGMEMGIKQRETNKGIIICLSETSDIKTFPLVSWTKWSQLVHPKKLGSQFVHECMARLQLETYWPCQPEEIKQLMLVHSEPPHLHSAAGLGAIRRSQQNDIQPTKHNTAKYQTHTYALLKRVSKKNKNTPKENLEERGN